MAVITTTSSSKGRVFNEKTSRHVLQIVSAVEGLSRKKILVQNWYLQKASIILRRPLDDMQVKKWFSYSKTDDLYFLIVEEKKKPNYFSPIGLVANFSKSESRKLSLVAVTVDLKLKFDPNIPRIVTWILDLARYHFESHLTNKENLRHLWTTIFTDQETVNFITVEQDQLGLVISSLLATTVGERAYMLHWCGKLMDIFSENPFDTRGKGKWKANEGTSRSRTVRPQGTNMLVCSLFS